LVCEFGTDIMAFRPALAFAVNGVGLLGRIRGEAGVFRIVEPEADMKRLVGARPDDRIEAENLSRRIVSIVTSALPLLSA
jgi:hypothetical protein